MTRIFNFHASSQFLANAFLICIGALLMVVGVNYARMEINGLVHNQATATAHTWSSQLVRNAPELPQILSDTKENGNVQRQLGNNIPTGHILGYRIYDLKGRLRIWVDGAEPIVDKGDDSFRTQVTLPLMYEGAKIGTLMTDVDSAGLRDLFMTGATKIGLILSSAIGFILLISLLVRANARQENQRNIKRLMQNDSITGMPNQLAFREMLMAFHSQEVSGNGATHMHLVNIDRFTHINERLGNKGGDRLLRSVADRMLVSCGDSVVCARLSGDTFGVLSDETTSVDVDRTLERLFAEPFEVEDQAIRLTASVGTASSISGMYSTEELQRHAEFALRAAKTNGGQQMVKYDSETVIEFRETEQIAAAVEAACENNSFELHYQPIVDSKTRKLRSFEALIRLTDSDGNKIGPDKFIPVAESIGRIEEIGLWTLNEACRTLSGLPKHIGMAVNLSVQQFASQGLFAEVEAIIKETRIDPRRLELEVTEGIMIGESQSVFKQLTKLQQLGIKIALDDFGTGYSSLNYLWRFSFDKLKIDQAFIRASDEHPKALALLRKIVEVGRTQDMKITAEGIETEAHAKRVAELGCDYSQGYLFGKAIPQTELANVVISEFADYIRAKSGGQAIVEKVDLEASA